MKATFSKAVFESELAGRFGIAFKPRVKAAEFIPTGIGEVDALIHGLPRGGITEIFGLPSSGRTTLILTALAEATARDEVCAWVDMTDTFHPASAATLGVCLDKVLWLRCGSKLEHAFKATDLILQAGGFSFVVLDLGDVPVDDSKRIISSWWYRFRRVLENTPTVFLVLAQDSCVRSCASMILAMKRTADEWSATAAISSNNRVSRISNSSTAVLCSATVGVPLPTHSNLLTRLHVQVERRKPVLTGKGLAEFNAQATQP